MDLKGKLTYTQQARTAKSISHILNHLKTCQRPLKAVLHRVRLNQASRLTKHLPCHKFPLGTISGLCDQGKVKSPKKSVGLLARFLKQEKGQCS